MRILSVTAGAAGMYCGSCARDNALARELLARGHDVTLLPLYTPTRTDDANVSHSQVLFGGISVYLQQHVALFRSTPRFLDRLWDSPSVIRALAGRSISTDPHMLGDLTISMLQGANGILHKEFQKLLEWMDTEPVPDIIDLSNSMLIGLAGPLRESVKRPVCCTLQGEDLFLSGLPDVYRARAIELIHRHAADVDRFIAVSDSYRPSMAQLLDISPERISVVPLGIDVAGYEQRQGSAADRDDAFHVGYFARVAPEKGLQLLADAYRELRRRTPGAKIRLEAAGYLSRAHAPYLEKVRSSLAAAGLGSEFVYRGELDRSAKLAFLRSLDVLSVPATYDEPKGLFLLEAMASGVPVVQPRRGAFIEVVERTGGGILVAPDDPVALADGLFEMWQNRARRESLGQQGFDAVRQHYTVAKSADRLLSVYAELAQL